MDYTNTLWYIVLLMIILPAQNLNKSANNSTHLTTSTTSSHSSNRSNTRSPSMGFTLPGSSEDHDGRQQERRRRAGHRQAPPMKNGHSSDEEGRWCHCRLTMDPCVRIVQWKMRPVLVVCLCMPDTCTFNRMIYRGHQVSRGGGGCLIFFCDGTMPLVKKTLLSERQVI